MDPSFISGLGFPNFTKKQNLATKISPDAHGVYHVTIDTSKHEKGCLDIMSFDNAINRKTYEQFMKDVSQVPDDADLKVHLKSLGGEAFFSTKIAQFIKVRTGKTVAVIDDYAMSGATLIALMCDEIEMSKTACLGAIDLQMWLGPVNCILPAAKRWKDKSMIADMVTEFLDKKHSSVIKTYEYLLQTKYDSSEIQKIIEFFYSKHDHEKPLFFDDLKDCTCICVNLKTSEPANETKKCECESESESESESEYESE